MKNKKPLESMNPKQTIETKKTVRNHSDVVTLRKTNLSSNPMQRFLLLKSVLTTRIYSAIKGVK